MYHLISTYPHKASQNVGDRLITETLMQVLCRELRIAAEDFTIHYADDDLRPHVSQINSSRGLIFACLPIRPRMFKDIFRVGEVLNEIQVPITPVATGSMFGVRDFFEFQRIEPEIDQPTIDAIRKIASQCSRLSCRDAITYRFCKQHRIGHPLLTGDIALFDLDHFGSPFPRQRNLTRITLTEGHDPRCFPQLAAIAKRLAARYPDAEMVFVEHAKNSWENMRSFLSDIKVSRHAAYGNVEALDVYNTSSLHVGYRLHAHVHCLSKRRPSVILASDSRPFGYGLTLGRGFVFPAFEYKSRHIGVREALATAVRKRAKRTFIARGKAQPVLNDNVVEYLIDFIENELENGFRSYVGVGEQIDAQYEVMRDFIHEAFTGGDRVPQ